MNFSFERLASPPSSPVIGQSYYNTIDQTTYLWDGSEWLDMTYQLGTLASLQARRTFIFGLTVPGTWYDIPLDTTDIENEPDVIKHNTTNTDVINIKADGLYRITTYVDFGNIGVNPSAETQVILNDTSILDGSLLRRAEKRDPNTIISSNFLVQLSSGSYLTLQARSMIADTPNINKVIVTVIKLDGVK